MFSRETRVRMDRRSRAGLVALLLALAPLALPAQASPAVELTQVADLHPSGGSAPGGLTPLGDRLYFAADDGVTGRELWRTDGASVELVADIHPSGSSAPGPLTAFDGHLYFTADDGSTGQELWRTDGTATHQVADIHTSGSSFPAGLTVFAGHLYFLADHATLGRELWRTDGSTTQLVADVHPTGSSLVGSTTAELAVLGDHLYFRADDGDTGEEVWRTDGSNTERVEDINASGGSFPAGLTVLGEHLYFEAFAEASGRELWRTDDATPPQLERVEDINPGEGNSGPILLTVLGDHLYFTAEDGSTGRELWRTDGTTAEPVADLAPSGSSSPEGLTVFDDALFFAADDGTTGVELWRLPEPDVLPALACGVALLWVLSHRPVRARRRGLGLAAGLAACAVGLPAGAQVPVPADLSPGDSYQLLFVSSQTRTGESDHAPDYDAFVQALADAAGVGASEAVSWRAVVSTPSVDARDHAVVGTNTPVYNMNGAGPERIATGFADLWDCVLDAPRNYLESGEADDPEPPALPTDVWTGSLCTGIAAPGLALGNDDGSGLAQCGNPVAPNDDWIQFLTPPQATQLRVYALSQVLTVPAAEGAGMPGLYAPRPQADPFYAQPRPFPDLPPGTILDARRIVLTAEGTPLPQYPAWNLKFVSRDVFGQPVAAVATVAKPILPASTSPRPLVAYQMFENSVGTVCLPSAGLAGATDNPNVGFGASDFLAHLSLDHWAVVVPDHQGTPNAYGDGKGGGYIALDAVRAAERFAPLELAGTETPVAFRGFSGGSGATAWAGSLHPTYAPELDVVAVAPGGVLADLDAMFHATDGDPTFFKNAFTILFSLTRVYPAFFPPELFTAAGVEMVNRVKDGCDATTTDGSPGPSGVYANYMAHPAPFDRPEAQAVFDLTTLPDAAPSSPTADAFVYHAAEDEVHLVETVDRLVEAWCADGTDVVYLRLPTGNHISAGAPLSSEVRRYLQSRFDPGLPYAPLPAACDCDSLGDCIPAP